MQSRQVITAEDAQKLADTIVGLRLPIRVTWTEGKGRSLSQNALLHGWFGEIAEQTHTDATTVKGQCHHKWGVPIRSRDAQWLFMWEAFKEKVSRMTLPPNKTAYEVECAALASGNLKVSSGMTTKELKEYLDAMSAEYRAQGIKLTEPEDVS